MSSPSSALHDYLIQLTDPILDSLSKTHYTPPPESTTVSVKSALESYLSFKTTPHSSNPNDIKNFTLAIALISSSSSSNETSTPPHESLSWIPKHLPPVATSALESLSREYIRVFRDENAKRIGDLGIDCESLVSDEKRLVVEVMCDAVPFLKERIKESSIGNGDDEEDEVLAASARVPVGYSIMAAYQFRWFVSQVEYPHLGKLCNLVIPCALTALDHWSPEVKGQGMISFIHLAKNVNAAELGRYEDVILDACCQNIASSDEIWHHVVEMSVLLVTSIQRSNPRSPWFERMLNEMLSHLERQPRNKERCIAWLKFIEPLLNAVGLVLLAHFRRIFPLFFKWMHSDDDEIVLLVLKRIHTVIRLTWIRNTPYVERLVDELVLLFKEAALRRAREEIRTNLLRILTLLQQCKGPQFEAAWDKHRDDPNLKVLSQSLSERNTSNPMALHAEQFQQSDCQRGSESLITQ